MEQIKMTLHTAIARSAGNKATTHLNDGTELIVHELSFLLRVAEEHETIIKRYDVMHITADGLLVRWNSCTPSELLYQLRQFGIEDTSVRVWMSLP